MSRTCDELLLDIDSKTYSIDGAIKGLGGVAIGVMWPHKVRRYLASYIGSS